ncbi:MAG: PEP-CTERM sorting domain-containing protein [Firmicutes bacterium]|nr:PEP-CTERM sorting domain-containing protein [Bacillota bacterium]
MRTTLWVLLLSGLLVPATVQADTLTFRFQGGTVVASDVLSNSGAPSELVEVSATGASNITIQGSLGTVEFSSGAWNDSTWSFDPGGSITITSNGAGGLPAGVLFSGTFTSAGTWTLISYANGTSEWVFESLVSGTASPELLAALGLPSDVSQFTATITIKINALTGIGTVEFGSIVSHTPEPGTLALLGVGLGGMAMARMRRLRNGKNK